MMKESDLIAELERQRRLVYELETNCDPAGTVREAAQGRDTIAALGVKIEQLTAACAAYRQTLDLAATCLENFPKDPGMLHLPEVLYDLLDGRNSGEAEHHSIRGMLAVEDAGAEMLAKFVALETRAEVAVLVDERISEYLQAGGLFNPELMEHDKVRDLLIDIRDLVQGASI